jgi:nucleotide-binding universal stress UspA family protein
MSGGSVLPAWSWVACVVGTKDPELAGPVALGKGRSRAHHQDMSTSSRAGKVVSSVQPPGWGCEVSYSRDVLPGWPVRHEAECRRRPEDGGSDAPGDVKTVPSAEDAAEFTALVGAELGEPMLWTRNLRTAMAASSEGRLVVYVPEDARIPRGIRRVLVPHDGTSSTSRALERTDAVMTTPRCSVAVLQVAVAELTSEPGSLPAPRYTDQVVYALQEWREEFARRFFNRLAGSLYSLDLALGPVTKAILNAARRLEPDLLILGWHGIWKSGHASTLRAVCAGARCPVLLATAATGADVGRTVSQLQESVDQWPSRAPLVESSTG